VDGAKVGVFEQVDQVGFSSFLESKDRMRLETEIIFEILRNGRAACEGQAPSISDICESRGGPRRQGESDEASWGQRQERICAQPL